MKSVVTLPFMRMYGTGIQKHLAVNAFSVLRVSLRII